MIEKEPSPGGFPDSSFPIEKDIVWLFAIDDWLECGFVSLELFISTDKPARLIIFSKRVSIVVNICIAFEHSTHILLARVT
ncbi:hypothetical protein C484_18267 [Natrialba taiwanensis DSM 12281]|uniref:Uncharacterized protein n=1 Tax=Natrialba taiwanensis DSM 12281 TaxID=1230458 RepID=L9ZMS6_9EURY|nr:hypothetical protein C484_18267 [Natrialba taiwanensis DSM 12281]